MTASKPESADVRCPSCKVVVLKKERYSPSQHNAGAPDFCPKCGGRIVVKQVKARALENPLEPEGQ